MMKNWKMIAGVALLVQAVSFVVLFVMLYQKKKSLANTFLAIGTAGGLAGSVLVLKEMKDQVAAREKAAMDACTFDEDDDDMFDECAFCYGDCDTCELDDVVEEIDDSVEETPAAQSAEFGKDANEAEAPAEA